MTFPKICGIIKEKKEKGLTVFDNPAIVNVAGAFVFIMFLLKVVKIFSRPKKKEKKGENNGKN